MKSSYFIKAIPILTGLSILSGFVKNYVYFKLFGIEIISYLSIEDALKYTLENFIFICFGGSVLIMWFTQRDGKVYDLIIREKFLESKILNESNTETAKKSSLILGNLKGLQRIIPTRKNFYLILFTGFLIFVGIWLVMFNVRGIHENIAVFNTLVIFFILNKIFTLKNVLRKIFGQIQENKLTFINLFVVTFLFVNTFSIIMVSNKYYRITTYKECRFTSVIFDKFSIPSYGSKFYIGETNTHIFFYSDKKISEIYPKVDVKKISINTLPEKNWYFQILDSITKIGHIE